MARFSVRAWLRRDDGRVRWFVPLTLAFLLVSTGVALADFVFADADALSTATPHGSELNANQQPGTTVAYDLSAHIRELGADANKVFVAEGNSVVVTIARSGAWLATPDAGTPPFFTFTAYNVNEAGTIRVTVPCGTSAGTTEVMTAVLTGTPDRGSLSPASRTLTYTITAQGPDHASCAPTNSAPSVSAEFDPAADSCGTEATLKVEFTDPDAGDTHTATVDWGDGSSVESLGSVTSPFSASHLYGAAGAYKATVTVTDAGGLSDSANAVAQVHFTIVSGNFGPPLTGTQNASVPVFNARSTIPAKVEVLDCDGEPAAGLSPLIQVWLINTEPPPESELVEDLENTNKPDSGSIMRFTDDGIYMYNLAARSLPDANATYRIRARILLPNFTGYGNYYQYVGPAEFGLKSR